MAGRPRVGVTGNARRWAPAWWCTALALRLVGAIPERISVHHPPSGEPLDALIIGGGNDISPEHYRGEIDAKVRLDPERDRLEIAWIRRAIAQRLPLLGICRGAQLINVVLGGNLRQDIRHLRRLTHNRPGLLPTKQVHLEPDSLLARICGKQRLRVNSLHHQAVKHAGEGLRVVGHDRDRIVQAFEGQVLEGQAIENRSGQLILGVQWHPEYLLYVPAQLRIIRWLVERLPPP